MVNSPAAVSHLLKVAEPYKDVKWVLAGLAANFGSMAKPFHAGRAAQSGVLAARLAAAGMTAAPDALERPPGFLHAVSPHGDVDLDCAPALIIGRTSASSFQPRASSCTAI